MAQTKSNLSRMSSNGSQATASCRLVPVPADDRALLPVVVRAFKMTSAAVFVWMWGYLGFSIAWMYVALCFYVAGNECRKIKESKKLYAHQANLNEKEAVLSRVDEHPSWVYFPDVEKAEWFNKVIKQMWPFIDEYFNELLKPSIEQSIRANLPSSFNNFKFETFDLGDTPMRIDGIKVYSDEAKKEEIVCDIDVRYAGDAKIKLSVNGVGAGIKSVHLSGTMRLIMNPLVEKIPIIGALSLFFLNRPTVHFDLTEAANILDLPILKKTLKNIVESQIASSLVLPNRIPIPLGDGIDISKIKYPTPQGVILLYDIAARDLKAADTQLFGSNTSDPYCIITVGANVLETKAVKKTLVPQWKEHFEIIVDEKYGQSIEIEVKDKDLAGGDQTLGMTSFAIETIAKKGEVDLWQQLEEVDTGSIHIKAKWLKLCLDLNEIKLTKDIVTGRQDEVLPSSAVLIIHLDKAEHISEELTSKQSDLNLFVLLTVGGKTKNSSIRSRGYDPCWNESFQFLVDDPDKQLVTLDLKNKGSSSNAKKLGSLTLPINSLYTCESLTEQKTYTMTEPEGSRITITMRWTLRILVSDGLFGLHSESDVTATPAIVAPDCRLPEPRLVSSTEYHFPSASFPVDDGSVDTEIVSISSSPKLSSAASVSRSSSAVTPEMKNKKKEPGQTLPADISMKSESATMGQIQLTVRYSIQSSQLYVVIHHCRNLIPCDKDNLADPYVRIYIQPDHKSTSKRKTKPAKNTLNPTFDETFEWQLPVANLSSQSLDVAVKNDVSLFASRKSRTDMGHVTIPLSAFVDPTKATTAWYDLNHP